MALPKKLLTEAQHIMDSYYQDFAPGDSFWRIEDFANWIGKSYGKYADDVAKEIYKNSLQEMGTGMITFSQDWWAKKEYTVTDKGGELFIAIDFKSIGFNYDNQNSQIQELLPVKTNDCGRYIRTTLTDLWTLENMTKSNNVWWWLDMDKIKFKVIGGICTPKNIAVYYIPAVDDDNFKLPSSKEFDIATLAFNYMTAAKKETPFVDMTNDRNRNVTQQTESDLKTAKPVGS